MLASITRLYLNTKNLETYKKSKSSNILGQEIPLIRHLPLEQPPKLELFKEKAAGWQCKRVQRSSHASGASTSWTSNRTQRACRSGESSSRWMASPNKAEETYRRNISTQKRRAPKMWKIKWSFPIVRKKHGTHEITYVLTDISSTNIPKEVVVHGSLTKILACITINGFLEEC